MIGSTGEVGSHVFNGLLHSERVSGLLAVARKEAPLQHGKLRWEQWDFTRIAEWPQLELDVAISCLGTTLRQAGSRAAFRKVDLDTVLNFARWSKANGAVEFHLLSALGASATSKVFYNQVKGELETAIEQLGFERLWIYQPSLLDSERKERRIWERIAILLMRVLNPLLRGRWADFRSIRVEKVAAGMLARLGSGNGRQVVPSKEI